MQLELTNEDAGELRSTLEAVLNDLHHELAATENPDYLRLLRERRDRLSAVLARLAEG